MNILPKNNTKNLALGAPGAAPGAQNLFEKMAQNEVPAGPGRHKHACSKQLWKGSARRPY